MTSAKHIASCAALLLILTGCGSAPPAPDASIDPAVEAWLTANAIPLNPADPTNGDDDLAALRDIVGDAHVVALGEGTHGTREFFQMKHRMVRYMVEEMGFTALITEMDFSLALQVDAYIQGADDRPASALEPLTEYLWYTQEFDDLIEWMRAYNADKAPDQRVHFYGFDITMPLYSRDAVTEYVRQIDKARLDDLQPLIACTAILNYAYADLSESRKAECHHDLEQAYLMMQRQEASYTAKTSHPEFALALQRIDLLRQAEQFYASTNGEYTRDDAMAENVIWYRLQGRSQARYILWAHNGHTHTGRGSGTMGDLLNNSLGSDLVSIGFLFNQGSFNAFSVPNTDLFLYTVPPAPAGSIEHVLASVDHPQYLLDLGQSIVEPALVDLLAEPQPVRSVGNSYDSECPPAYYQRQVLSEAYDALVFINETTGAQFQHEDAQPDHSTAASDGLLPTNLDFESGDACWFGDTGTSASLRYVREEQRGGEYSARLNVTRHHEGESNAIVQYVSGAGLSGRSIRLSAYLKTEDVRGGGAGIFLITTHYGEDWRIWSTDLVKQLSEDHDWTQLTLNIQIPSDTVTIRFGAFMTGRGKVWVDDFEIKLNTAQDFFGALTGP